MKIFIITIPFLLMFSLSSHGQNTFMSNTQQSEQTVRNFLDVVRSGKSPERASEFMADSVKAHQLNAEDPKIVIRSPENYAQHVNEFLTTYGHFQFEVTELIASNDKVYARWKQTGNQIAEVDGFKPTGLPVIEIGSVVYRVANGKIVEYWVLTDRKGAEIQQQTNAQAKPGLDKTSPPYSDAYISEDMLYISGQIGTDHATGKLVNSSFEAEVTQAMENLGNILRKSGLHYKNLVNVTIYLTSMDNYAVTNAVYSKYFDKKFPARVCIAVKELPLQAHIEIAAVAGFNN
jgi:reactive intermediate/imine deaminase